MDREELYRELSKQTEEMSAGERMEAYLQGEEVDFQPFGFLSPEDALTHIWGYTKGEVKRSFEVRQELIRRKKEEYGIEGIGIPLGLRGMAEVMGSKLNYPEDRVDYVETHVLQDYGDLDALEEMEIRESPLLLERLEEGKRLLEKFPGMEISTDCAGPFSTAISVRPIEKVLRDIQREPEKLHRLLRLCVRNSLIWIDMFYKETGSAAVGIADPVTTSDILGKKYFQEFSQPYIKELIGGIEKITGQKPSVHICGHTRKIWDGLMEAGVANFSIDNCESMEEAKNVMGDRVFLSGNVDPVDVLQKGTIHDVIQAVKRCLLEGSDNPCGYMLMSGCQVPMGTPRENMDAYIYAARKYGARAKLGRLPEGLAGEE
ncbi:MAG TPA: uroporphyrinogen decarboxylase family protein [Candidatus Dorea gallistercoris]|uniref:Uroporphyrinogen decarboxylase family protein n=1 Tax=Candidatus Dorea gallistercoris TaxID=2838542 RepID=A0A9D1UD71_9FIRM|nr:uroporphyrinogen decarboxylase family protein [Candidatus Dorea gallistercoris]